MRRYYASFIHHQPALLNGETDHEVYKAADVQAWLEAHVLRDQHIGTPYNNGWNDCLNQLLADLARE